MNLYIAFSLFALIILIYWIISELFTIFFRFTGLPDDKARFQVTSLLTGCGYTTRESELFVSSRARRRLARVTMLFGYVFNITIVTALINVFLSLKETEIRNFLFGILIPLVVVAAIIIVMRVPSIRSRIDRTLEKLAGKVLHLDAANTMMILDYVGKNPIARITLEEVPDELKKVPLSQSRLKSDKNILVILVQKVGKKPFMADADTVFEKGDKITVFGEYNTICDTFNAKENFSDTDTEE